ncbi:MAG: radical SAM protein [Clostridia bacterium]|nr:radical SAM protein [Clostridia bacterium]
MENRLFRIGPIRPPSEADSLLIQVTNGCTWNKCRFCQLYRHTKFRAYSADSIKEDIDNIAYWAERIKRHNHGGWDIPALNDELASLTDDVERQCYYMVANWLLSGGENVFLQDGNTTALSSGRLTDVLKYLRQVFPQIRRITSYGRAENLSKTSAEGFAELKEAGLDRIHSGYETGSDAVLERINKGVTQAQQITAGKAVKAGGIELSIYFMPGVGGRDLSQENAAGTAHVISEVGPDFVRIRTAAIKPGTELHDDWQNGLFELCSDDDKVREIKSVIELSDRALDTEIRSDHMINLLQDIDGRLKDRDMLLDKIDRYLEMPEDERRLFQLLRRTLRAYGPEDMRNLSAGEKEALIATIKPYGERAWSIKMNEYICRYV